MEEDQDDTNKTKSGRIAVLFLLFFILLFYSFTNMGLLLQSKVVLQVDLTAWEKMQFYSCIEMEMWTTPMLYLSYIGNGKLLYTPIFVLTEFVSIKML